MQKKWISTLYFLRIHAGEEEFTKMCVCKWSLDFLGMYEAVALRGEGRRDWVVWLRC